MPLRLRGISKRFGDLIALDGIGFDLGTSEILALLGENGAGKTTLLNIICGHYKQDKGEIRVFGNLLPPASPRAALSTGIGSINQHSVLAYNETGLDNIILGTEALWKPYQSKQRARQKLKVSIAESGLDVPLDVPVGTLSVGEQQRVEILKALYRDVQILILDEPTAMLTPQQSARLFGILRGLASRGMSIIFVSHRMNEVMALSHRVVVLRAGQVVADIQTANATEKALTSAMIGAHVPSLRRQLATPGEIVLALRDICLESKDGRRLLDTLNLDVRSHEIVGIAGVSGNGQTPLSEIVAGVLLPSSGSLLIGGTEVMRPSSVAMNGLGVGRVPEDRLLSGIIGDMSIEENLIGECYAKRPFAHWGVLRWSEIREHARKIIAAYDIRGGGPTMRAANLSGGNIQKVVLARALSAEPRVVLASQPTRGLDVANTARVHQQLLDARRRGAGILLISEDLDELLALSDRIAVIYRGRLTEAAPVNETKVETLGFLMSGQSHTTDVNVIEPVRTS
jgi:ABC-type uncharacterized transport system ATPase subunit